MHAPISSPEPAHLYLEYSEVNHNIRALAEVRFKLLGLVPTLGGVAIYVLSLAGLGQQPLPLQSRSTSLVVVILIAALGLAATLGILFYDQRNSELYNALIHRAKYLEGLFDSPRSHGVYATGDKGGQFQERPTRQRRLFEVEGLLMGHDTGLALVYGPVLGAWAFPLSLSLIRIGGGASSFSALASAIVAAFMTCIFTGELLYQDAEDRRRWQRAAAGGTAPLNSPGHG